MLEYFLINTFSHIYNWIEVLFAPTTIVAIIVLFVAIQQYALAKEKLRLDSYDKRYQLFEFARTFLDLVQNMGIEVEESYLDECDNALNILISRIDDAIFLFKDTDIHQELIHIRIRGKIFLSHERSLQIIYRNTPRGVSLNTPSNVRNIRLSNDYKSFLIRKNFALARMFSEHLVIRGSSPLTIFFGGLFSYYKNRISHFRINTNHLFIKYFGITIFPLSLYSLIIIGALEATLLVCFWIIIG